MTSRYYNSHLIVVLLSFLCIMSCGRTKIKKKLSEMQERPLRLSFDDMLYIGDKGNPCRTKELTWIVYHDSVNCKPCLIGHLPDWDSIRNHPYKRQAYPMSCEVAQEKEIIHGNMW